MAQHHSWWRDGVIYQIYPRSFMDSNGDGIGDLRGIIEKLPYLSDLGIRGIWLSPINTSPMFDFGYDVSDYRGIDPIFGTTDDFLEFVAEAHRRNIKVIMDMVLNHTSHLHPWFVESRSSRSNPKRDWYVWHDGTRGRPPNNWLATFGGRAWEWDEHTSAYYLHSFTVEQPDLNWFNPEVRTAAYAMLSYWMDQGVDGFRFDVMNWFGHDREFRSNPFRMGPTPRPYDLQRHLYDRNLPVSHEIAGELRRLVDSYGDRMMVCEVYSEPPGDPDLSSSYAGPGQAQMTFDFSLMYRRWDPRQYMDAITLWNSLVTRAGGWPSHVLSNHDQPRSRSRFGRHSYAKARVAAVMHMTLRGTPFLYYGEEIGMENRRISRPALADPLGKRYWPFRQGRDPERTPMQWNDSPQAGFTAGTPWLPVHPNHRTINVQRELTDDRSLLNLYRMLIALRNRSPVLQHGVWEPLHKGDEGVLSYYRRIEDERLLILLNFRNRTVTVDVSWQTGSAGATATVLVSTHRAAGDTIPTDTISLRPFEATILGSEES